MWFDRLHISLPFKAFFISIMAAKITCERWHARDIKMGVIQCSMLFVQCGQWHRDDLGKLL